VRMWDWMVCVGLRGCVMPGSVPAQAGQAQALVVK
jgi:hypothetical protein